MTGKIRRAVDRLFPKGQGTCVWCGKWCAPLFCSTACRHAYEREQEAMDDYFYGESHGDGS